MSPIEIFQVITIIFMTFLLGYAAVKMSKNPL